METTVECFIEKVRNRPCLWNMNHVSYRDVAKKDAAWERVAKECGMSCGRDAKSQWKKLRDSHREALRRRKPEAGPSAQYLKPWKYEEDMRFILSQSENKDVPLYSNDSNDTQESNNDNLAEANNMTIKILPTDMPDSVYHEDPLYSDLDNRKRKGDMSDIYELEKLREERERHREELLRQVAVMNRNEDALSKLFESLCYKTRDLPKYLQLRVQREIFDSVSRAEEEALALDPVMNAYNSVSPRYNPASVGSQRHYDVPSDFEAKLNRKSIDS